MVRMRNEDLDKLLGPFPCRRGKCDRDAEFYADLPAEWKRNDPHQPGAPRILHDAWEGHFCKMHLLECLVVQLDGIHGSPLRVRRIR